MKVKELINVIESDCGYLDRMKGSHRQYKHPIKDGTVTIAGKLSTDMPKGTIISVLKQAKLKEELFNKDGIARSKFSPGQHTIAVKAVDNEGLEAVEVVRLKVNGKVEVEGEN